MTKKAIVFTLLMLLSAPALMAADLYGYLADKNGKPLVAKVELRDTSAKLVAGPVTSDAKGYRYEPAHPATVAKRPSWCFMRLSASPTLATSQTPTLRRVSERPRKGSQNSLRRQTSWWRSAATTRAPCPRR